MTNEIEYVRDSFEEYLSKNDHISDSDIKLFLESPQKYYYESFVKKSTETTKDFEITRAFHECVTEFEKFKQNYLVMPKYDGRTTEGKEAKLLFEESTKDKTVIDSKEMTMITQMSISAKNNNTLMKLIMDSNFEVSCYTTDLATGLKLKIRPYMICKSISTICDFRPCFDASADKFHQDTINNKFSITHAFQSDFLRRENYIFAASEKTAPYQISLFALSDDKVEQGRKQYRMALDLIKWSLDNNFWCNYNEFEVLKECYRMNQLDNFFHMIMESDLISIIK